MFALMAQPMATDISVLESDICLKNTVKKDPNKANITKNNIAVTNPFLKCKKCQWHTTNTPHIALIHILNVCLHLL